MWPSTAYPALVASVVLQVQPVPEVSGEDTMQASV